MVFLDVLFQDARRQNPVIKDYVRRRGQWPTPEEKRKLVQHINGSFIFASAVFKFIIGYNAKYDPTTPMDHLPLALKMDPGLDGLYAETLACSEHIPHYLDTISTITLLRAPLPISGIAELLGIHTYEVVHVLVDLQAIFQVPGTDDIPVTLSHTSATSLPPKVDQTDSLPIRVITSVSTFASSSVNTNFVARGRT